MLYAEICPKVRRHNARPELCLLTLGHISAYNMDDYTLYQNAVFWLVDERGIFVLPIVSFVSFSAIAGVFA